MVVEKRRSPLRPKGNTKATKAVPASPAIATFYQRRVRPQITRKRIKIAVALFVAVMIILPIGTYAYYAPTIRDRELLMNRNNTGIILKDRNGNAFYSSGVLSTKQNVPLSQISDNVEKAVVASEDKSFYSNWGFSIRGTLRAFGDDIVHHDATRAGGSTITQQLVKNKLLGAQKSYLRKYQEIAMAVAVERHYSKGEILDMYLNSAYFGDGAFGIGDAAHTYFNKDPKDLTLAESAMLAGVLPAPSSRSPITGSQSAAKAGQANVLRKMVATGAITEAQRTAALQQPLQYANGADKGGAEYAQHYADMIIQQLNDKYGEERVKRSGFAVTTTLDLRKQKTAEQIVRDQIATTSSRGGTNAGLVSIDPKTGQVLALVGSVDYYNKQFGQVNMATALRQPGSSFKPIYYSDAIDRGLITAGTILDDSRTTFGGTYTPHDYDNRYKGKMAVRNALAESRNVPAVEVMQKEGIQNAASAAQRFGITTIKNPEQYGLSLALGTAEVQLIQMTSAYTAFANQGERHDPILYTKIVDKYGKVVEQTKPNKTRKAISPEAAYVIDSILSDTSARAPTYGTTLNIPNKTVALKTGTTNDNRDAWTIGFTPSIVTGVWMGNNESKPMIGLAGGSGAGAIWKQVMTQYLHDNPNEAFPRPSGIKAIAICDGTNERATHPGSNTHTEYYKSGTEPTDTCNDAPATTAPPAKKQENQDETPTPNQQQNNGNSTGNTNPPTDNSSTDPTQGSGGGTSPTQPTQPTPPSQPTQPTTQPTSP